MRIIGFIIAAVIWGFQGASAHPVSYKGATSLMSENQEMVNELMLAYSWSHQVAVGVSYLRKEGSEFSFPRINWLLKRWNNENSQGNLYLNGGMGLEKAPDTTRSASFGELMADWESRKHYVAFRHLRLDGDRPEPLTMTKARLGFAPFLADYEDLNVWYIAQFEQSSENPEWEATQFLRFYLKNVLWEIGAGFNGNWAFNLMLHL